MERGDRVFLHDGNTLEFFADLLAVWWLGGCVIPIDGRLTPFEVETLARAARPRFSLWRDTPDEAPAGSLTAEGVEILGGLEPSPAPTEFPPSPLLLEDDALILFTSGTTGDPKGVVHTHRSLRARWTSLRENLGTKKYRNTLCLLPTHFGHGLICNCLFPWLSGQNLFLLPPFRADVITGLGRIVDENEITFMSSVPSVWRLALKVARPPEGGTLNRVFCGSAPLSAHMWRDIQRWSGTSDVMNSYGITETGSWVAGTTVEGFVPEDGLIGRPWGAVVRILGSASTDPAPSFQAECPPGEQGYVWLNTPALMRGYLDRDDLTAQVVRQGWFMTGDIGLIDDRGLLFLRGREREEINKGGMKVYPGDIDSVAEESRSVSDVCAFAVEDELYGQNVGIAVVMTESDEPLVRRLVDFMSDRLAKHQMPVRWYLLEEIPRTSRGKVNRERVAEYCSTLSPMRLPQR
jgi:acyl-CoA synthetase (AMP-forming)/AMP-acid ligase II